MLSKRSSVESSVKKEEIPSSHITIGYKIRFDHEAITGLSMILVEF